MDNNKIDIPENLQQICREMAEVAIKNNLHSFSGTFTPPFGWSGQISFNWTAGRHNEDSDSLNISSQFFVHTTVKVPKEKQEEPK